MTTDRPSEVPSSWRAALGHVAVVVPLAVALFSSSAGTAFRDDPSAVRSLGLVPIGSEGWLSTVAGQLVALLPVGGRWLRAAWVSAFALALCSRLLYGAIVRVLERSADMPRLTPALALAGALVTVLSPGWQAEGTLVGGATLAVAVILAALRLDERFAPGDVRRAWSLGLGVGLATIESHAAGLSLLGAALALAIAERRVPSGRTLALSTAAALGVVGLAVLGGLTRPLSPHAALDLGSGLGQTSLTMIDASAARRTAFEAWLADVGLISFALALVGLVSGALVVRLRPAVVPFIAFVFADLALPEQRIGVLAPDPFAPTRLCAIAALGFGAALGVQQVVLWLERAKLPFSRPAAVLLVAFNFTLVLGTSESSAQVKRDSVAAEAFTDEALASLAPRSLLLVRSEALIHRLLAAQLVRGERPDVLVVPSPLLERGGLRRRLLALEPELAPLLREMALRGRPGEFSLAQLSDTRPLYVELDPSWEPRLLDHLGPRAFFTRYYVHPLGHSDRRAAIDKASEGFDRVVAALGEDREHERATRAVLISLLRERATLFHRIHDGPTLAKLLGRLEQLDPEDSLLRELVHKVPRAESALGAGREMR